MKKLFERKPTSNTEDTIVDAPQSKSKKKAREVEIAVSVDPAVALAKKQKELTHAIKVQTKVFVDLVKQTSSITLGADGSKDKLVQQQLKIIGERRSKADGLLTARETLLNEYKLIRFNFDVLSKKQELTSEDKTKAAKLLSFFVPTLKINPESLTQKEITKLEKLSRDALKMHREMSPYRMTETLIKNDERDLLVLTASVAEMRAASDLVTQRLLELKQKDDKPKLARLAAQGVAEPAADLAGLKQQLSVLEEEIKLTTAFIRHTHRATPQFGAEPEFNPLWQLQIHHNETFGEMIPVLEARASDVAKLTDPNAFRELPLEGDRLRANIASAQKTKAELELIKGRLVENLTSISQVVEQIEKERKDAAQEAHSNLKRLGEAFLLKIKKMQQVSIYTHQFGPQITDSEVAIKKFLTNEIKALESSKDSVENTSRKEGALTRTLHAIMAPVLKSLVATNTECFANRVDDLQRRLELLKEVKQASLSKVEQFTIDESIALELNRLKKDPENYIADRQYCDDLIVVMEQVKRQEATAKMLLYKIQAREASPERRAIAQMLDTISAEIGTLETADQRDPRVPILKGMRDGLHANLSDYLHLKTDSSAFVVQSLKTIEQQCSKENLSTLSRHSSGIVSSFVNFVRGLVEPIHQLIKKVTGTTYSARIFAQPTESNVAEAAEAAHTVLTELEQNLSTVEASDDIHTLQR